MTARAHVKPDPLRGGVGIAVARGSSLRLWELSQVRQHDPGDGQVVPPPVGYSEWLTLGEDEARALYEALADFFGHSGHDTRALRKDYDAERARVDKFINSLIGGAQ